MSDPTREHQVYEAVRQLFLTQQITAVESIFQRDGLLEEAGTLVTDLYEIMQDDPVMQEMIHRMQCIPEKGLR